MKDVPRTVRPWLICPLCGCLIGQLPYAPSATEIDQLPVGRMFASGAIDRWKAPMARWPHSDCAVRSRGIRRHHQLTLSEADRIRIVAAQTSIHEVTLISRSNRLVLRSGAAPVELLRGVYNYLFNRQTSAQIARIRRFGSPLSL